ncbi:hypothetical protein [Mycobacterium canetti]|uniref:hypothetical protein n=1 Tax=Mycobacterium canetti TaxID=78331 RepID=UPI0002A5A88E|nr:hypothetical protein [Mycobacterium canetti]CCK62708.1 Conserved integral membrane protein of unknown function [Mycobacterium canettii CIPT 140070017]
MTDLLVAAILSGAFGLALWGAWRPRYRAASYVVAGVGEAALIAVLVATAQADWVIVSVVLLLTLFGPLVVVNHLRAERRRGSMKEEGL